MKLTIEVAQAFVNDAQARIDAAKAAGQSEVDIELSAREAAVSALDEAQQALSDDTQ